MSNLIYGRIICNDVSKIAVSKIDFSMVHFCLSNDFAIHFIDTLPTKNTIMDINFQLSDNFLIHYCEFFMEPIIYDLDGTPKLNSFYKDLDKLQRLIQLIYSFEFVDMVELRFSYVEVDECDYEICETNIDKMKPMFLSKYLCSTQIPVVNFIIKNAR